MKRFNYATTLTLAALALATVSPPLAQAGGFELKDFRVEGVGALGEGSSYSAVVSYLPKYSILDKLDIKGNIGVSAYKGSDSLTPVLTTGILASYRVIDMLAVELGGGAQTWTGAGSAAMINANVNWIPSSPILGRINKVVAGYSNVQFAAPVNEVRIGVELNLGTLISGAAAAAEQPAAQ
jgi:hypothetical protein